MKKSTLFILIIGAIILPSFIVINWIIDNDLLFIISSLILMIYSIISLVIRKNDVRKEKELESIYKDQCDPEKYLEVMEKQMKGYVKTKISNIFFKIRKADFLNEAGKYSESREILEELIPYEYMMNNAILTSYYKVWINYFLEYGNFKRVEILLEQMQQLVQQCNKRNMIVFCNTLYFICLSKYNVLSSRDLNNTEQFFASLVNSNNGMVYSVVGMYYLALIALDQGLNDVALKRCEFVFQHANKLKYKEKAEQIILKLKSN